MTGLTHDLRQAWRVLVKSPGFTAAATLTLALGVGLNAGVFSVVNALLFKPLPVAAPAELVHVYSSIDEEMILTHAPMAFPDYEDLRDQTKTLSAVLAHAHTPLVLEWKEESELILGEMATGNFFATLGLRPARGRFFSADEDRRGDASPVAVLSHAAWQRRFGGDPAVVGSTLRLNGHPITIVGVATVEFTGLIRGLSTELWLPVQLARTLSSGVAGVNVGDATEGLHRLDDRARRWIWVTGRRQPGVSIEQVEAELATLGHRLAAEYPESNRDRALLALPAGQVRILPGLDAAVGVASLVVMAIVGLVLLIASANLANMLLARALSRRKEIATRLALGASRAALVRQLLVESLLLALLGGTAGLLLALAGARLVGALQPQLPIPIPLSLDLSLDFRMLLFTLGAATFTALLFGLAPALEALRTDLAGALHESARSASEPRSRRRLRSALVIAQVALSLLLLVCSGLSLRSMRNAQRIHPGFEPAGVVVASLAPQLQGYSREQAETLYLELRERLGALPAVRSTATASHLPLAFEIRLERTQAEGRDTVAAKEWPTVDSANVGPGYFATLGIPILRGRAFTEQDGVEAPLVAVVNATLAERFWPGEEAIGKRLRVDGFEGYWEVVGIARDGKYRTLGEASRPYFWRPSSQVFEAARTLLVAFDSEERTSPAAVRQVIRELDEDLAVSELGSLQEAIGPSLLLPRYGAGLFGLFGLLGLALAAVGLYGVIAYNASRRTHEIGIRVAMGARRGDVLRLVVGDGLRLAAIGVGVGLIAAFASTRALAAILYGISATDLVTFVSVPLLLAGVAVLAAYLPARRAAGTDPLRALHSE